MQRHASKQALAGSVTGEAYEAVPASFSKRELLALCSLQQGTACATADAMTSPSAAWQVCCHTWYLALDTLMQAVTAGACRMSSTWQTILHWQLPTWPTASAMQPWQRPGMCTLQPHVQKRLLASCQKKQAQLT